MARKCKPWNLWGRTSLTSCDLKMGYGPSEASPEPLSRGRREVGLAHVLCSRGFTGELISPTVGW